MDIAIWVHFDTKLGLQKDLYWQEKYKAIIVMKLSTYKNGNVLDVTSYMDQLFNICHLILEITGDIQSSF